ncbi:MAG: hypothetical protein LBJ02_01345 [Bifidobacteriaceae bacterium]|jgi:hypothetical protein|nr:hypothetical protein [Bifidobacteriaceae bacterium]
MIVATVVIAPSDMVDTAIAWARRGLIADSLWLRAENLSGVDYDSPNAIMVTRLRYGAEPHEGPLALQLSGLESLDEARVAAVRSAGDTDAGRLEELADLLRELLPHDIIHWIDVVVPERRTDETVTPLAGAWVQFRIDPSDRPAPDRSDAGWDLGLAAPLHVTLALAGILGGTTTKLPWARLNASGYRVVRAFSRLVDGGTGLRQASRQFVHEFLPTTHGAVLHPHAFLAATAAHQTEAVEAASVWLANQENYALVYVPLPPTPFADSPRAGFGQHMRQCLRFVPVALRSLFTTRPNPARLGKRIMEGSDLGYHVGPETARSRRSAGIVDFGELEAQAIAESGRMATEARTRDGGRPPARVWDHLARVATALVDGGGGAPPKWPSPQRHGRRLTVPARAVSLGTYTRVSSPVPEIGAAVNSAVAAVALNEARRPGGPPIADGQSAPRARSAVALLAAQANQSDAHRLALQVAGLGSVAPRHQPTLFDRVEGRLLGGMLRARLDAERWEQNLRTGGLGGEAPSWKHASAAARWTFWVVTVALALTAVWVWRHPAVVLVVTGFTIDQNGAYAILAALFVLLTLVVLYWLFRCWLSFMEMGRRRLELISLWLSRVVDARRRQSRLANAERIARGWFALLAGLLAEDPVVLEPTVGAEAEQAPMAMRIGRPRFTDDQMRQWLAQSGGAAGWRLAALQEMAGQASGAGSFGAVEWLTEDPGLSGGRIDSMLRDLGRLQSQWRATTVERMSAGMMSLMAANAGSISVVRNPALAPRDAAVGPFLDELTPPDDDRDDWPDDERHSWVVRSGDGSDPDRIQLVLSPALCAGRFRVQVKDPPARSGLGPAGPGLGLGTARPGGPEAGDTGDASGRPIGIR